MDTKLEDAAARTRRIERIENSRGSEPAWNCSGIEEDKSKKNMKNTCKHFFILYSACPDFSSVQGVRTIAIVFIFTRGAESTHK